MVAVASTFGLLQAVASAQLCGVNLLQSLPKRQLVNVPGDYIISVPGTTLSNMELVMASGSVIIAADDVTLNNIHVRGPSTHTRDGIIVAGVERAHLRNVLVERVGGAGILLQDGSGHDISECLIRNCVGAAIVLDQVSEANIIGVTMITNGKGIDLIHGSHHNRILGNIGRGYTHPLASERFGYRASADSYSNQFIRTRTRDGDGYFISLNPDNVWYHSECWKFIGFCGCYHAQQANPLPKDYGDPSVYAPRTWTVCEPPTFAGEHCDFDNLTAAVAQAAPGDIILFDMKISGNRYWPAITVDKPLWLIGETRGVKGTYTCEVGLEGIQITSPGVRLQNINFKPGGAPSIIKGTEVINVQVQQNQKWTLIDPSTFIDPPFGANLHVSKTTAVDTVHVNDPIQYTLRVQNTGPETALNVRLVDPLPPGVSFISVNDPACGVLNDTVECNFGPIASGGQIEVQLEVAPLAAGSLENSVTAFTDSPDPDPQDNSATHIMTVLPPPGPEADVSVRKSGAPNPVLLGQTLSYSITVSNSGPDLASNVHLMDVLPAGVSFQAASGGCGEAGGEVNCFPGSLPPGGSAFFSIDVAVNQAGVLDNVVTVSADQFDPVPANNQFLEVTLAQDPSLTNRLFACDDADDEVYVYDTTGALVANFPLPPSSRPYGVAVSGGSVYILDWTAKNATRHTSAGTLLATSKTFKEAGGNNLSTPQGLAVDGDQIWLVDKGTRKLYRYSLAAAFAGPGTLNALQEIVLDTVHAPFNTAAVGLAIDASYLYVLDSGDNAFYRCARVGLNHPFVVSKTMKLTGGGNLLAAEGATRMGGSLWVVDRSRKMALQYDLNGLFSGAGSLNATSGFSLDPDNADAKGL